MIHTVQTDNSLKYENKLKSTSQGTDRTTRTAHGTMTSCPWLQGRIHWSLWQQELILVPHTVHVVSSTQCRTLWAWRFQSPRGHRNQTLGHSLSFNSTSTSAARAHREWGASLWHGEWVQWLQQDKRKAQRWKLHVFWGWFFFCWKSYWFCHICLINLNFNFTSQEKSWMCHLPYYGVFYCGSL